MIGIIDSGFGGLSVVAEIFKQNKQLPFVYLGDNLNNPYGTKSKEEITCCTFSMIDYLITTYHIDTLFIACNTICAASLEDIKKRYPTLHIESIAHYGASSALMSFNKHVTVLATNFTTKSKLYENLIKKFDSTIDVQSLKAQEFVNMVETGEVDIVKIRAIIKEISPKTDIIILGCTHFPFLYSEIRILLDENIQIIDPAVSMVALTEYEPDKQWKQSSIFLTTGDLICLNKFLAQQKFTDSQINTKKVILSRNE